MSYDGQLDFTLDSYDSGVVSRAGAGAPGIELSPDGRGVLVPCVLAGGPITDVSLSEAEVSTLSGVASAGLPMRVVRSPENVAISAIGFREILGAAYQVYLTGDGAPPDYKQVSAISGVSLAIVRQTMLTKEYAVAAKLRGIAVSVENILTPEQELALQIMSDPTIKGGLRQRLKLAGVSHAKYRAWSKNPIFRNRLNALQGGILKELEGDMMVALGTNAADGDLNAIKYSFEVTGRHNPARDNAMDTRAVIASIIEILQQEIQDPALLNRIGLRMQGVALQSQAGSNQAGPNQIEGS